MDLSALSYSDLRELSEKIDSEMKRKHLQEVATARETILSIAKSVGLTVESLLQRNSVHIEKTTRTSRGPLAPRYVNPDDSTVTWSGVGRAPKWVRRHTDAGGLLDALRIPASK
jgi:DNA-binding protein H-NS